MKVLSMALASAMIVGCYSQPTAKKRNVESGGVADQGSDTGQDSSQAAPSSDPQATPLEEIDLKSFSLQNICNLAKEAGLKFAPHGTLCDDEIANLGKLPFKGVDKTQPNVLKMTAPENVAGQEPAPIFLGVAMELDVDYCVAKSPGFVQKIIQSLSTIGNGDATVTLEKVEPGKGSTNMKARYKASIKGSSSIGPVTLPIDSAMIIDDLDMDNGYGVITAATDTSPEAKQPSIFDLRVAFGILRYNDDKTLVVSFIQVTPVKASSVAFIEGYLSESSVVSIAKDLFGSVETYSGDAADYCSGS